VIRALLSPPGLVGLLLFVLGVLAFALAPTRAPLEPARPALEGEALEPRGREEVALLVVDENEVVRSEFVEFALPAGEEARLAAVLASLRELLLGPLWPEELSAPRVFLVEAGGRRNAVVLDFDLDGEPAGVTVQAERRLIDSIVRTVRRHADADGVYFLVGGQSRPTLLGHVALERALN
jgi:hypothetical protein